MITTTARLFRPVLKLLITLNVLVLMTFALVYVVMASLHEMNPVIMVLPMENQVTVAHHHVSLNRPIFCVAQQWIIVTFPSIVCPMSAAVHPMW